MYNKLKNSNIFSEQTSHKTVPTSSITPLSYTKAPLKTTLPVNFYETSNKAPLTTTLPVNFYRTSSKAPLTTTSASSIKTTESIKNITWPFKAENSCDRSLKGRPKEEGRWYDFSRNDFVFYAYSVLIDDRLSLKSGPVVRIISIATNVENLSKRPQLYCRFRFPLSQVNYFSSFSVEFYKILV